MTRCLPRHLLAVWPLALAASAWMALLPGAAHAQTTSVSVPYMPRTLPVGSLRGELKVVNQAEALLNGEGIRLAPGVRIVAADNTLVMPNLVGGTKLKVNYTVDLYGLVKDVWILRADELAKRWPKTAAEAAKWTFDPVTQTWTP